MSAPSLVVAYHFAGILGVLGLLVLVVVPIGPRVRLGFHDRKHGPLLTGLALLFDILWTGILFVPAALIPTFLLSLVRFPGVMRVFEIAVAVGLGIAAYGVLVRRRWTRVRRVEVELPRLPPSFDGYRIVQLSDVHVGTMNREAAVKKWVETTNALAPDLVAITGDLLSSGTAFHDEAIESLGGLRARDAVVGCLGNHDYYSEDALCRGLEANGLRMLRNRGFTIEREKEAIYVAGVEDHWRGSPDLDAATRGANGAPVVLLAHNPDYFPIAREAGVALTLSGHTHAGQIAVPFAVEMLNLSRIAVRWSAGVYRDGDAVLFVHAGLGTTGPAIRIGAAPEIVEITLRKSPD
jgi:predicted MPP superfamily phosphohydrolase